MAKVPTIEQLTADLPVKRIGPQTWEQRLERVNPEKLGHFMVWITQWHAGRGRDKLNSETDLAKWLADKAKPELSFGYRAYLRTIKDMRETRHAGG